MGADLYLNSEYERRQQEFNVEALWIAFSKITDDPKVPQDLKDKARAEWGTASEKAREGCYFRDSYNESSLAWLVRLSYWQSCEHCDENGLLSMNETKRWLDAISAADIPTLVKEAVERGKTKDKPGRLPMLEDGAKLHLGDDEKLEDVIAYFEKKKANFITLLQKSLDLKEGLYWSV
jgi:hypothetical protein